MNTTGKRSPLNKFGAPVAGLIRSGKGHILVLPQMPSLGRVVLQLMTECFAEWNPSLFPDHEGLAWLHRPEYEIPKVVNLQQEIEELEAKAAVEVAGRKDRIGTIQAENADWYTLLNGTGDELVQAVIRSLKMIGFKNVVDVDEEERAKGNQNSLLEDIRIEDMSPVLVIDVKGITGCPEDEDANQPVKHALIRIREFETDVQGLALINHQRNLPPSDRDPNPFRTEIIENAAQTRSGLMTTWDLWDLFCLLRNKEKLGWSDVMLRPILYRTGRIEPIPNDYVPAGKIVKTWKHSFGVVPDCDIKVGNRLAVEIGDTFDVFRVETLQVDGEAVEIAPAGSNCGVGYQGASTQFRRGSRVFLIAGS